MPTPDFVLALREKVGTALLWLPAVTAVVLRGQEVLLVRRADTGAWTPVTGIVDPGEQPGGGRGARGRGGGRRCGRPRRAWSRST